MIMDEMTRKMNSKTYLERYQTYSELIIRPIPSSIRLTVNENDNVWNDKGNSFDLSRALYQTYSELNQIYELYET